MNHRFLLLLERILFGHDPLPSLLLFPKEEEIRNWKLDTPEYCLQKMDDLKRKTSVIHDILIPNLEQQNIPEMLSSLQQFLSTKPILLKRKIIWWPCPKSIPETLQNKLLKMIEESNFDFIFLFLIYRPMPLLPTFLSRMFQIKNLFYETNPLTYQNQFQTLWQTSKVSTFQDFQNLWEQNGWDEKYLLTQISDKLLNQSTQKNSILS